jgi:hypothetical protein
MPALLSLALLLADPAHAALDRLAGCWAAAGTVGDKPVTMAMRGSWRLGGRYLLLEAQGLDPADPYDAAVVLGDHDGDKVSGWWMDSFGAGYSAAGAGGADAAGIRVDFAYPNASYVNRFTPDGAGWAWTITEHKPAGDTPFASYRLTRSACGTGNFPF